MLDHQRLLNDVLASDAALSYGFVARSTGALITEAGARASLPFQGIADVALRPESVIARYRECESYALTDPRMVPRTSAQGPIYAVIGIPSPGFLLVVFGLMPAAIAAGPVNDQVAWCSSFRRRVWSTVQGVYGSTP